MKWVFGRFTAAPFGASFQAQRRKEDLDLHDRHRRLNRTPSGVSPRWEANWRRTLTARVVLALRAKGPAAVQLEHGQRAGPPSQRAAWPPGPGLGLRVPPSLGRSRETHGAGSRRDHAEQRRRRGGRRPDRRRFARTWPRGIGAPRKRLAGAGAGGTVSGDDRPRRANGPPWGARGSFARASDDDRQHRRLRRFECSRSLRRRARRWTRSPPGRRSSPGSRQEARRCASGRLSDRGRADDRDSR